MIPGIIIVGGIRLGKAILDEMKRSGVIDKMQKGIKDTFASTPSKTTNSNSVTIIDSFFRCLGSFARYDFDISKTKPVFHEIMSTFNMSESDIKKIKTQFEMGWSMEFETAINFHRWRIDMLSVDASQKRNMKKVTVAFLCAWGKSDYNTLPDRIEKLLFHAGQMLGYKYIVERCLAGDNTNNIQQYDDKLQKYYKILGCSPMVSDEVIKITYREKQELFSCDSLQKLDVPKSVLKDMEKEMQEITKAYNEICKKRNIK